MLTADRRNIHSLCFSVPAGVIVTTLMVYVWLNQLEKPDPEKVKFYELSVYLYGGSAMLELFAEPLLIMSKCLLFVKLRVFSEGVPMLIKCICSVSLVILRPQLGILSFAISQVGSFRMKMVD